MRCRCHSGSLVLNGKIGTNPETIAKSRDISTGTIEVTIEIVRAIREVALIETTKAIEIVKSRLTSRTPPHSARKTGIATDPKSIERVDAVLADKLGMALTALEEDLLVRAIFPLQTNEAEGAHVIRMFPHPLILLLLDMLMLFLLRIRILELKFLHKMT